MQHMRVTNFPFRVSSSYWNEFEQKDFCLNRTSWRTKTFDWIHDELQFNDKTVLSIESQKYHLGESDIQPQKINALVAYSSTPASSEIKLLKYESPKLKSSNSRVKTVLVNPTKYWVLPSLGRFSNCYKLNFFSKFIETS